LVLTQSINYKKIQITGELFGEFKFFLLLNSLELSLAPFEKIAIADVFLNIENQDFKELTSIQLKKF